MIGQMGRDASGTRCWLDSEAATRWPSSVAYHPGMAEPDGPYVSRGGIKLAAALERFALDPAGWTCADLGCSVGGFTDCLLQHGAAHVFALDTAYGDLAWRLRQDSRVTVLERTNALHFDPAAELSGFPGCDLVVLDLGWTRQAKAVPAALRWLKAEPHARLITLIKPHYEAPRPAHGPHQRKRKRGKTARTKAEPLSEDETTQVLETTLTQLREHGVDAIDRFASPITGSKGGNIEYLALLRRVA